MKDNLQIEYNKMIKTQINSSILQNAKNSALGITEQNKEIIKKYLGN